MDNQQNHPSLAPLRNVGACLQAMETAINRPAHLSGIISFYGPSGWGKTTAAVYVANEYRAYHIEVKSVWSQKGFLKNLCKEMGIKNPAKIAEDIADQVIVQLATSGRPLIIDEFDHIISKKYTKLIRDISDGTGAAILLIGEENIDISLSNSERLHGRVMDWVPAHPANIGDAVALRNLYCKDVDIADDLLAKVVEISNGSIRRICSNLERIQRTTINMGATSVNAETWGDQRLDNGKAPTRRVR